MFQKNYQVKKRNLGKWGEQVAAEFLISKGYKIIAQNFYLRAGELDIIAKKDGILSFVEVKTRSTENFGSAQESLSQTKKRALRRSIQNYLQHLPPCSWQLDLIAIDLRQDKATLKHFKNIL